MIPDKILHRGLIDIIFVFGKWWWRNSATNEYPAGELQGPFDTSLEAFEDSEIV